MADDTGNGEKPGGANGEGAENKTGKGNAGQPNADSETQTEPIETPSNLPKTQAELDAIIDKRLKRAAKEAKDNAELTETERLKKENADLKRSTAERDARDAFITKCPGVEYAKASRLFSMYKSEIEFDDNGKPSNLADVIKTAGAEWPDLFGTPKPKGKADAGAGNGGDSGGSASSMNALLRGK